MKHAFESRLLDWGDAPKMTIYGTGMAEAVLPLGKDYTLWLYADSNALSLVEPALRAALAQPEQQPVAWREMIEDTKEVFDYGSQETPQLVRDVIEYVKSWMLAAEDRAAQPQQEPKK